MSGPIDLTDFGPLYHSYEFFGARSEQLPASYAPNQRAKAPIITAYIALALADVLEDTEDPSFIELFCADAYYAMVAGRLGARQTIGVDNFRDDYKQAVVPDIAARLGIDGFKLVNLDVAEMSVLRQADVVANIGGLYHVMNPEQVLRDSYDLAKRYLIVQSVVSLATDEPDYFEAPAPGQDWGSRYSVVSFDTMIRSQGWNILAWHQNELTGNPQPENRGSVYYLVAKD